MLERSGKMSIEKRIISGFTLAEVLIGSVASVVVMSALVTVYLSQMSIQRQLGGITGQAADQLVPELTVTGVVKRIELADRIVNANVSRGI